MAKQCWLVVRDPWGWVGAGFTHLFALATASLINLYILFPGLSGIVSRVHAILYNCAILALLVTHLRCMFTNPGTAADFLDKEFNDVMRTEYNRLQRCATANTEGESKSSRSRPAGYAGSWKWWCTSCDTFRPRHTHHCSTCGICVLEMDHCPWVNNCVGWRNHKYFLQFLFYTLIGCVWSSACIITAMVNLPGTSLQPVSDVLTVDYNIYTDGSKQAKRLGHNDLGQDGHMAQIRCTEAQFGALHCTFPAQLGAVACCIMCILLALFICVMVCDQCESMSQGYGIIDRKQLTAATVNGLDDWTDLHSSSEEPATGQTQSMGWLSQSIGEKLPLVMGDVAPWGLGWLLPIAPSTAITASVPPEELITHAQQRYFQTRSATLSETESGQEGASGADGLSGSGSSSGSASSRVDVSGTRHRGRPTSLPPSWRSSPLYATSEHAGPTTMLVSPIASSLPRRRSLPVIQDCQTAVCNPIREMSHQPLPSTC